jgi:hypothetical protein
MCQMGHAPETKRVCALAPLPKRVILFLFTKNTQLVSAAKRPGEIITLLLSLLWRWDAAVWPGETKRLEPASGPSRSPLDL